MLCYGWLDVMATLEWNQGNESLLEQCLRGQDQKQNHKRRRESNVTMTSDLRIPVDNKENVTSKQPSAKINRFFMSFEIICSCSGN
jgi:hypothetical protein